MHPLCSKGGALVVQGVHLHFSATIAKSQYVIAN